ncbi:COX15/CtaA family protein [Oceanicoccus sagamiensis]|uniref:Cytochrome B n=1 Tax=Oceanicoccus sagamiensis TaxID=716816 RepID=A0A1X9N7M0_9GAMM|nr:COX15/CtaA family protein [Oceanicoccus sagamiensis]ARN74068.1 cytochrome B [Oceanicoccus sagamiensis]
MALFNSPEHRLPGFKLALTGCIFAVFVLGLGAFTRLADAGLGCPDWPGCYGHVLWPTSAEEVDVANQAYPDMPVEHDKTWPEMVHRYFAQGLGYITIGLFVLAVRRREQEQPVKTVSALLVANVVLTAVTAVVGVVMEPYAVASVAATMLTLAYLGLKRGTSTLPFKLPAFLLAFIILQGLFGMWTVTLKLWPQVVTSHLLGGFTTFSLLWLLTLRLNNLQWQVPAVNFEQLKAFRRWAAIGLVVVFIQVALGGWTTSNYAAVACPDLPTCQNQWLPEMDFKEGFNVAQSIGPNYLGGTMDNEARIAIHFSHRVGAIITTAYLLFLMAILYKGIGLPETRNMASAILGVLILQVALGLGNIIFQFPVSVAVAHNLVGALLLITMVTLNHRVYTAKLAP